MIYPRCPLRIIADMIVDTCPLKYCAWYDEEEKKCVLCVIADRLKQGR